MITERRAVHAGVGTRELFVEGDGPTIVLLHGFGHPADTWLPVLRRFADAGQSAVAVDLPGFGAADTSGPGAWLPQGDRFVGEVVAHYGGQAPVVLVGNSLGATLTVRAAGASRQLPIRGILPAAMPGMGWTPLVRAAMCGDGRLLTRLSTIAAPTLVRRQGADRIAGHLIYGDRAALDVELVRILSSQVYTRRGARDVLERGLLMKAEVDAEPPVLDISCPAIVVHGRRDRIVALASSVRLHQTIPHSRLVVLDKAGHSPQLDAPDEIVTAARNLAVSESPSEKCR